MSGGTVCKCPESKKPIAERAWVVYQRNQRCSAFDGYRVMYSEWSAVGCNKCSACWRTKAPYVMDLKNHG